MFTSYIVFSMLQDIPYRTGNLHPSTVPWGQSSESFPLEEDWWGVSRDKSARWPPSGMLWWFGNLDVEADKYKEVAEHLIMGQGYGVVFKRHREQVNRTQYVGLYHPPEPFMVLFRIPLISSSFRIHFYDSTSQYTECWRSFITDTNVLTT
jgi:hypothetical protein